MKINSVYISAFGKFEDKTFNFTDGLNVIYGENEDGKTTLMNFIHMMFYGSSAKSSDPLYNNPRKKYLPRSDKPMAGSIDFTLGNRKYRIERIFKATNSGDKIAVTDLSTGERETFTGKEDLGKRFIGLSEQSAQRSIFLSTHGAISENPTAQDELNSRLSNLADTGSEEVSVEAVTARLEKARNAILTKTQRGGKLVKDKERLNELILSLNSAKATEQSRKELALRIENQKAMLNDVNGDIARLTAQIKAAQGGKRYAKLKELVDCVKTADSLASKLVCENGAEITHPLISEAESGLSEYKVLSESLPAVEERHTRLTAEIEKLKEQLGGISADEISAQAKSKQNELKNAEALSEKLIKEREDIKHKIMLSDMQKPQIRPAFPVLALISLMLCVLSFIIPNFKTPLLVVGAVLTAVCVILTFVCRKKPENNSEELKQALSENQQRLSLVQENIDSLSGTLTQLITQEAVQRQKEKDAGEHFTAKFEEFKECDGELNRLKDRIEKIESLLKLLSGDKKVSVKGMEIILFSHKSNLNKMEEKQMRIAMLKKDLDGISIEEATAELAHIPEGVISAGDPDELDKRLLFKKQEAESLRQKIADDTARAATEFAFHTHPTLIEKEISQTHAIIEKETAFYESIDIAMSVLSDAFAKVRESFGSALAERTAEIFSGITMGKYKGVNVSKSFNISVEETDIFGTNDWQTLSDGTIDQAYFALRLAVSEFLSKNSEKLPLILDDPFDRYDDRRAENAMEFLNSYAKDGQALIFTCHKLFTEKYPFILLNK